MEIGAYLRQVRVSRGLSVRQLSERVGVHPSYASRVERGKSRASREYLTKTALSLRISRPHLLSLGGFMPEEWSQAIAAKGLRAVPALSRMVSRRSLSARSWPLRGSGVLRDPLAEIFPGDVLLSSELNEVYELQLAKLELSVLSRKEIVERGAYFLSVGQTPTNHCRICTGGAVQLPREAGGRLKSFLSTHHFKSSYATHGLFPYRGKFHPQMIKAIVNVMGLKPGDTLLDPMCGSGTTSVEASLMGIDSVSVDASPFCVFMTETKVAALSQDVAELRGAVARAGDIRRIFAELNSESGRRRVQDRAYTPTRIGRPALDILALAFMDARGYASRSSRRSHEGFFGEILPKYVGTIDKFQTAWKTTGLSLGGARALVGDARVLPLAKETVDGIVFSPPYSFAIDYVQNDLPHLEYLGVDSKTLRESLVGLRGKGDRARVHQYFADMHMVLGEAARVLRRGKYCTIIVGSNSNQLARALGVDAEAEETRYGIEAKLTDLAKGHALGLDLAIRRLIVGMANSMREEHILFFRKEET